ncbi:hypothetical protein SM124_08915 [Bacillus sp. 31A1R]|uniref:Uncharacterized protein n=1 Tax=Robertmurraya mangrovi TaxID=3098077 RepID=A0ABU5IXH1_9BACI|nr:hypothetical protein [Bacillus sp. 31A1R]MDZ5471869.1 hypothetical protein [Bacillus sp. 31A1R]
MKGLGTFLFTLLTIFPFAWLLYKQISTSLGLSSWAKKLKRRDATQLEAEQALAFLKQAWWVPNHPKYWGCCKTIYHSVVVSNEVNFETKMTIFNRLDKLKCHGIVRPIKRSKDKHA